MPRKQKKYHFIYKTTNLINGKYYIGMHSTDNLDDGYMGSGRLIRRSISKYGREKHEVEIIEFLDSRKELIKREKEIVNLTEIEKIKCLNLVVGGCYEIERKHFEDVKKKISETLSGKTYEELHGENASKEKEKRKNSVKKYWDNISDKEREKRINKQRGKKGPQKNKNKKTICPHCKKEGGGGLMKRWHFDNCSLLTGNENKISKTHIDRIRNYHKKLKENGGKIGVVVLKINTSDNSIISEFNNISSAFRNHNENNKKQINLGTFRRNVLSSKKFDGFYYKKK